MGPYIPYLAVFLWGVQNGWLAAHKFRQWSRQFRRPPILRESDE